MSVTDFLPILGSHQNLYCGFLLEQSYGIEPSRPSKHRHHWMMQALCIVRCEWQGLARCRKQGQGQSCGGGWSVGDFGPEMMDAIMKIKDEL